MQFLLFLIPKGNSKAIYLISIVSIISNSAVNFFLLEFFFYVLLHSHTSPTLQGIDKLQQVDWIILFYFIFSFFLSLCLPSNISEFDF